MLKTTMYCCVAALMMAAPSFAQEAVAEDVAPSMEDATQEAGPDLSLVLATVDGVEITSGHFFTLFDSLPPQAQAIPREALFPIILEQLVDQTLLVGDAAATGADQDETLQLTLANNQRAIVAEHMLNAVTDAAASEEAIAAEYDAIEGEPEYNARHILVPTEEDALAVIERAAAGEDFAELAKELSTGPSGPNGGDLGWFGQGAMVPAFDLAVREMEAGDVSEAPVKTQFGYHVIKLEGTRSSEKAPLALMRGEIIETLNSRAVEAKLEALREGAVITSDISLLLGGDDAEAEGTDGEGASEVEAAPAE